MKSLWTQEETGEMLLMIARGKTNEEIAQKLNRTKASVANKRKRLFAEMQQSIEGIKCEELPPMTAPEDAEELGTTELERELAYTQKLLDDLMAAIKDNTEILDSNMATMMERISELDHENTVLRDRADALEKDLLAARKDLNAAVEYLEHGPVWRLFHGFRKFREGRQE